jgi:hypothetical protein
MTAFIDAHIIQFFVAAGLLFMAVLGYVSIEDAIARRRG